MYSTGLKFTITFLNTPSPFYQVFYKKDCVSRKAQNNKKNHFRGKVTTTASAAQMLLTVWLIRFSVTNKTFVDRCAMIGKFDNSVTLILSCVSVVFFSLDVTPPTVQNCPSNITDRTNSLQKSVTWTPPTFTDNVAVVSVLSNREPGFIMDTYTSLTVQYTSSDAAGNVVYCTFDITLEGIPLISMPSSLKLYHFLYLLLLYKVIPSFFKGHQLLRITLRFKGGGDIPWLNKKGNKGPFCSQNGFHNN